MSPEHPDAPTHGMNVYDDDDKLVLHVDAYGPVDESTARALLLFAKWCEVPK